LPVRTIARINYGLLTPGLTHGRTLARIDFTDNAEDTSTRTSERSTPDNGLAYTSPRRFLRTGPFGMF